MFAETKQFNMAESKTTFKLFVINGTTVISEITIGGEEREKILDNSYSLVKLKGEGNQEEIYSFVNCDQFATTLFLFVVKFPYPTLTL